MQAHGVNVTDIKKLKEAGISTVAGVLMSTVKTLSAVKVC